MLAKFSNYRFFQRTEVIICHPDQFLEKKKKNSINILSARPLQKKVLNKTLVKTLEKKLCACVKL